jgi:hypothetical protein
MGPALSISDERQPFLNHSPLQPLTPKGKEINHEEEAGPQRAHDRTDQDFAPYRPRDSVSDAYLCSIWITVGSGALR